MQNVRTELNGCQKWFIWALQAFYSLNEFLNRFFHDRHAHVRAWAELAGRGNCWLNSISECLLTNSVKLIPFCLKRSTECSPCHCDRIAFNHYFPTACFKRHLELVAFFNRFLWWDKLTRNRWVLLWQRDEEAPFPTLPYQPNLTDERKQPRGDKKMLACKLY